MTPFLVAVDARNPGEFLAVCGLIELAGRLDHSTTAAWTRRIGLVAEVKTAASDVCEIRTTSPESTFATDLATVLGCQEAWRAVTEAGRVPLSDAIGKWTAGIELAPGGHDGIVVIDHWYERAFVDGGRVTQKHGKQDGKSRWKFWAGQQDSKKGIAGLLLDLVKATAKMGKPARIQDFLNHATYGRSPLKLDAATTRSSLDRGISANDAADEGGSFMRPALELLAVIGISTFFPPRRHGDQAPGGTVGVHERRFRYCTWGPLAPLSLVRVLARGARVAGFETVLYEAPIGGKEYSYLRYARPTGLADAGGVRDDMNEEDADD